MIADGNVCRSQLDALHGAGGVPDLGLDPAEFAAQLQTPCEDLLHCGQCQGSLTSRIDDALLDSLIREVDDPALQRSVMTAIAAAAAADGWLSEGERQVMDALQRAWGPLQRADVEQSGA